MFATGIIAKKSIDLPSSLEISSAFTDMGLECKTGVFQAHMDVELINDGPVTILLDSKKSF